MRKPVLVILIVLIVALLGVSLALFQKLQKSTEDYASLQSTEQETRQRYDQAINEIAAIQDSLSAIELGDGGTLAIENQLEAEKSLSQSRGEEAKARIARIKEGVQRARKRIQDLEAQLKESGVKVAGLEKMIRNLRATVAEREQVIAQLNTRVDELQAQVTGLKAEVAQGHETIKAQSQIIDTQAVAIEDSRRAIGTIYYAIGTKKELTEADLVESKGGILGLGKTLKPTGRIDETKFMAIDTDRETVIVVPAEKAKVLSAQPVSSYELVPAGGQVELRIVDPRAFRTVKHVIIMTG